MIGTFFKRTRQRVIWSVAGLRHVWAREHSFRYWVWANALSGALALALPLTPGERALILSLGVLVLAAELFNTAIERVVDLVTKEQHALAGQAKDVASAGVMMTGIATGVAWMVILVRLAV